MSRVIQLDRPKTSLNRAAYSALGDSELIHASQLGDQLAFECLLKRYERIINARIFQLVPNWPDKSDLVQEVFIKVWRALRSLHRVEAFKVWLRRLTTNVVYDHLRRLPEKPVLSLEGGNTEMGEPSMGTEITDVSKSPDLVYERSELDTAIRKVLSRLPESFRVAVVLRELDGLSYKEIVEQTGVEMGTVKSRIARARNKAKRLLSPYLKAS